MKLKLPNNVASSYNSLNILQKTVLNFPEYGKRKSVKDKISKCKSIIREYEKEQSKTRNRDERIFADWFLNGISYKELGEKYKMESFQARAIVQKLFKQRKNKLSV